MYGASDGPPPVHAEAIRLAVLLASLRRDSSSERYWHAQASFGGGPDDVPTGARCHVHVTANCTADAAKPVPDLYAAHATGLHSAVGADLLPKAPPPLPAAIFTAAKNKLLDGGGSGAWSPLSPGGTGASAQLAQLLGLFDEQAGGGGLGRSITESSDFILREVLPGAVPVLSHAALTCAATYMSWQCSSNTAKCSSYLMMLLRRQHSAARHSFSKSTLLARCTLAVAQSGHGTSCACSGFE